MIDFSNWTREYKTANQTKIVIMADMNQEVKEETTKYCLSKLIEEHDMISVLEQRIEQILPSVEGSNRVIDHILSIGLNVESIERAGQLPHGMGFQSNHRCIYADLNMEKEIGLTPMKTIKWKSRALTAKNKKRVDLYAKELYRLLEKHTVFARAVKLSEAVKDG